ncbi:molybdate transport system substrate-binding protein [Friedmanniella luteola]|uniref:Molybdate transport system substrate-binding protein n=1 Tax=Friedmanniella luteola TaxID=546871 RepID=A0A1H1Z2N2_9ACTN|nr:molybdate ABC transporter substrate-binding protein [Friedmanniella luteola]SDT27857.1 molybdate transport system substrate-binding protein [Friedmanniella luteola]
MSSPRAAAAALAAAVAVSLTACSADAPAAAPAAGPSGTVTVLAAASLTEAFTALGREFEAAHPGTTVAFSFGSSATLAAQAVQGAPADVFAAASTATMTTVTTAGAAADPVDVATNTLEIAVPPGNPGRVSGLADFADRDLRIALCAAQVPCGAAAEQVLRAAGVTAAPDTLESDVKAVLQKVTADEVDAGLVYTTDVVAAGAGVEGLPVPEAAQAPNRYPVAVLRASRNPTTARAFVDLVRSDAGRRVLRDAGFGPP